MTYSLPQLYAYCMTHGYRSEAGIWIKRAQEGQS